MGLFKKKLFDVDIAVNGYANGCGRLGERGRFIYKEMFKGFLDGYEGCFTPVLLEINNKDGFTLNEWGIIKAIRRTLNKKSMLESKETFNAKLKLYLQKIEELDRE